MENLKLYIAEFKPKGGYLKLSREQDGWYLKGSLFTYSTDNEAYPSKVFSSLDAALECVATLVALSDAHSAVSDYRHEELTEARRVVDGINAEKNDLREKIARECIEYIENLSPHKDGE